MPRNHRQLEPARPLPTNRVTAAKQLDIVRTVGALPQPFHVKDVEARLAYTPGQVGLVMRFFAHCELVTDAPGRGVYHATPTAVGIAAAWEADEEAGKQALREAWWDLWFVKSARQRLADGPGLRNGLHAQYMKLAKVDASYRQDVDRLLEIMTLAGMLVEEPDHFVRWHQDNPHQRSAPPPPTEDGSEEQPEPDPPQADQEPDATEAASGSSPGEDEGAADEGIPGPRGAAEDEDAPGFDGDADALLTGSLGLDFVWHLSPDESTALQHHLAGLLATLATVQARARASDASLGVELTQPLSLADLSRMSRRDWSAMHGSVQQLVTAVPAMRRRPTTA